MKKIKVFFIAVLSLCLVTGILSLGLNNVKTTKADTAAGSPALKLSIDLGENYNESGEKTAIVQFAKPYGSDIITFAAGDKIEWEVYSPSVDAGGLDAELCIRDEGGNGSDWKWMRDFGSSFDYNPCWAVATKGQGTYVKRSSVVNEGSDIIGRSMTRFAVYFGTGDSLDVRNIDIYYRNILVYDKDGGFKAAILNNFATYAFEQNVEASVGITSASVEIVKDPLSASLPAEAEGKALKLTYDLSAYNSDGGMQRAKITINSPADSGAVLEVGDVIEYDVYTKSNVTPYLDAQQNGGNWRFLETLQVREYNSLVYPSWTTLVYNNADGTTYAADLSAGWHRRNLMVTAESAGYSLYHIVLAFQATQTPNSQIAEIYFKNIRICSKEGAIKYNVFDGTQQASEILSNIIDSETTLTGNGGVSVVDDPISSIEIEREERGADSKYINLKLNNVEDSDKTFAAKVADVDGYTVSSGDKLRYSVSYDRAVAGIGGVDIEFESGKTLSSTGLTDKYGYSVAADADLGDRGLSSIYTNSWLIREVDLSSLAGEKVKQVRVIADIASFGDADEINVRYGFITVGTIEVYGADTPFEGGEKTDGTLDGTLAEPVFAPEGEVPEYVTFNYTVDDKAAQENRHYNISFYGYSSNTVIIEKGDVISYNVKYSVVGGLNAYIDYQVEGGTWTTLSAQNAIDQRDLQTEDTSFIAEPDVWYTKYFTIDNADLELPVAHWVLSTHVNGAVDYDEFNVSIGELYIRKQSGETIYLIGNGRSVFQGSIDIYGQTTEYMSGLDLVSVDTEGYTAPNESAPDKYIKVDYTIGALSVGDVATRDLYISLFGGGFTDYVFAEGDTLSYKVNLSAPLTGAGMLDFQVISPSNEDDAMYMREEALKGQTSTSMVTDNYGIEYQVNADISSIAYGGWATRTVKVPAQMAGYKLQHLILALSNSSFLQGIQFSDDPNDYIRKLTVLIGDIKVVHADGSETIIYDGNILKYRPNDAVVLEDKGEVLYTVESVPALIPPTIDTEELVFEKRNAADVSLNIDLKGANLEGLFVSGAALGSDAYAISDGVLTIGKEYLGGLEEGDYTFTLRTDEGECTFTITVEMGEAPADDSGCGGCSGSNATSGAIGLMGILAVSVLTIKRKRV